MPDTALSVPFIPSRRALFLAFLQIGVSAFGGALPWGRRILVEDRQWLDEREFGEIVTICQAVPGPNMVNMAIFIGTRYHGVVGALIAFFGIVGVPLAILLLLNYVYHSYAYLPQVQSGMHGMAAVATAYMLTCRSRWAARSGGDRGALCCARSQQRWRYLRNGTWRWCSWFVAWSASCSRNRANYETGL